MDLIQINVKKGISASIFRHIRRHIKLLQRVYAVLLVSSFCGGYFITTGQQNKADALPFGLDNDYLEIAELNQKFANTVPVPIDSIQTAQAGGDKRVLALHTFLSRYNSPMKELSVAK